jgi:hypothetical protein
MLSMPVIIVNSTTPHCRQTSFFNRLRKRNWVPTKTNQFDPFLQARVQARAHQFLTPKEHGFDMPTFLKYGSTGRPPGKFHLRHSLKEFTYNLEFSHPPFIEITNNNNINNINYIDNGGSGNDGTDSDTNDTAVPVPVGNNSNTNVVGLPVGLPEWFTFTDQIESINCSYKFNKYKLNIDGISSTTTATPAIATTNYKTRAEGISNEGGEDAEAAARLLEWFANRFESNQCNYKYKFNIDGISTTTAATPAPATMAEGISNEGGEDTEASAVSEWFAVRFESNHINNALMNQIESNRYKYNNNNKSDTSSCTTTTTTTTIDYNTSTNTSTYDDNKEADTAHSIHRTDKIKWFESISNNNNNKSISPSITNNTNTTTSTNNDDETSHLSLIIKLLSLCLIIIKSFPPKEFKTAPKEKQQQQQQQYHGKQRHQFHLEQQQHEHHNVERMVTSIVLKLSLVAWDMWAFRNVF